MHVLMETWMRGLHAAGHAGAAELMFSAYLVHV